MQTLNRFSIVRALCAALVCCAVAGQAAAETYPAHPIHLIVPTGAGGITDLLARIVAAKLGDATGQPVIVENRGGASGMIGSEYVAHARPDGYTLLFAYPTHVVNPALFAKIPYDTLRDFAPVTMVATLPVVLTVRSDFPAKSLQDIIAMAKKKPGSLNYSSVGNGSLGFLAAELFLMDAGIQLTQVPYAGTPQATIGLLSGDVSLFFDAPLTMMPLAKAGKVRLLGVTSSKRLPILPDVPAISEVIPGYEAIGWNGILAPAETPPAVISQLNQTIVKILKTPAVNQQLTAQGVEVVGDTPQEFGARIKSDIDKWGGLIKKAGIKAN
jgi:tripartite-type tricarboxylate transporter receptor subunit TctC